MISAGFGAAASPDTFLCVTQVLLPCPLFGPYNPHSAYTLLKRIGRIRRTHKQFLSPPLTLSYQAATGLPIHPSVLNSIKFYNLLTVKDSTSLQASRFSGHRIIRTTVEPSSVTDNRNASPRARPAPCPSRQNASGRDVGLRAAPGQQGYARFLGPSFLLSPFH